MFGPLCVWPVTGVFGLWCVWSVSVVYLVCGVFGLYLCVFGPYLRVFGQYTCVFGPYLRVFGQYLCVFGSYLCVFGSYLRVFGPYLCVMGLYNLRCCSSCLSQGFTPVNIFFSAKYIHVRIFNAFKCHFHFRSVTESQRSESHVFSCQIQSVRTKV